MERKMRDTQKSQIISTDLHQIAAQAKQEPAMIFISLAYRMDIDFLTEAYHQVRKDGAPGLSGVTAKEYKQNLDDNLYNLHQRLKDQSDEAPTIKRVWIVKDDGKKRVIGITEFEDKIVQKAVAMLLGAVYEQDFYDYSHGFREGHNAHQSLADIRSHCMGSDIKWLIDADISGLFDTIDRAKLIEIIKLRVNDGGLIRLIGKWLNAGVVDGEILSYNDKGTPQGGVISPVLANIYRHHGLDEWFTNEVQPRFGLTIHPEKSNVFSFEKPASKKAASKCETTFDFLGFIHYWARTRKGYWVIKRKTAKKKMWKSIVAMREWCRNNRHKPLK